MTPKYVRFIDLSKRLNTFNEFVWTKPRRFTEKLAAHGFFYIGGKDAVQCYQCGVIIHTWLETDDVTVEHFRFSPHCPLASEAINLTPLSKKLLTEILKKLQFMESELKALKIKHGLGKKLLPRPFGGQIVPDEETEDTVG